MSHTITFRTTIVCNAEKGCGTELAVLESEDFERIVETAEALPDEQGTALTGVPTGVELVVGEKHPCATTTQAGVISCPCGHSYIISPNGAELN